MASFIITLARVVVFLAVAASAIVSLYSAVNAMSVYSNLTVFASGLLVIGIGVLLGPLFAFIACYGFVYFLGYTHLQAALITAPALIAWCVVAIRLAAGSLRPR